MIQKRRKTLRVGVVEAVQLLKVVDFVNMMEIVGMIF